MKAARVVLVLTLLWLAPLARAESLEALARRCGPAVVVFKDSENDVFGSGVLVSPDGIILTAEHLFSDGEPYTVSLPGGRELPFKRYLFRDAPNDLTALEVEGSGLPYAELGEPEKVAVGASVVAIGNPRGLENTISPGIISGRRPFPDGTYQLQTTAPISPGSSGGGLFDQEGRLLAITVSYLGDSQNLNFAVPVSLADLTSVRGLDARIAAQPDKVEAYLERARKYYEVGEFELGHQDLEQVLRLDSKNLKAYSLRGEIFYRQGKLEESLADYTTVVALDPGTAQGYYDRAYTLMDLGRDTDAVEDFKVATQKDADFENAYVGLATSLSRLDRDEEAALAWTEALRLSPDEPTYLEWRGVCRYWSGQYPEARADLEQALEKDSELPKAFHYLGRLLIDQGDYEGAIKALGKAVALEPEEGEHYYHRANAHNSLESYEKALADVDRAVELGSDDALTMELRGDIFYNLGRYERATTEYSKSLDLSPDQASVLKDRGDAYAALGDKGAAVADYQKAIELDPQSEVAGQARLELAKLKK